MGTRDKVRQRRMERIKQLQETNHRTYYSPPEFPGTVRQKPLPYGKATREGGFEDYNGSSSMEELRRWNDPEYVWKRKLNREMAERMPDYYEDGGGRLVPSRRNIRTKLVISCILFAAIWGMFQADHPWANKGKAFITTALNEPFDFQPVALWYERQFGGAPTLLPALNPIKQEEAQKVTADSKHYFVPVKGKIIAPFEPSRLGLTIETKADATVAAMDTGLVVYAGSKDDTGYTVIIRHTNGLQSVYGWIEQGKVELNDWIKGGETIGTVSKNSSKQSGYLYFAVSKDNKFLNPADVVSFD